MLSARALLSLQGEERSQSKTSRAYPRTATPPAGAVLLDENLKELNLAAPTLVGPRAFARLQRALWSGERRAYAWRSSRARHSGSERLHGSVPCLRPGAPTN